MKKDKIPNKVWMKREYEKGSNFAFFWCVYDSEKEAIENCNDGEDLFCAKPVLLGRCKKEIRSPKSPK